MTSNSEIYSKVDFAMVYTKANEILVSSSVIEAFPYKIKDLIEEQSDIRLCKYSKAMQKYNIPIKVFGSESAIIQEFGGRYIIFYNQDEPAYRVRFSIMHEFAHYIFQHKMNLEAEDPLYKKQELEANCFAAQMLMPEQIIREAISRGKIAGIDMIKSWFYVSDDAATKRKKTLATTIYEWKKRAEKEFDDIILFKYALFINKIASKRIDFYDLDYELQRQRERDSFLDTRTRW